MQRKKLSNVSDPFYYEDLSESIQSGMANLGYDLTDPLGIALDLRDQKVSVFVSSSPNDPFLHIARSTKNDSEEFEDMYKCYQSISKE